MNAGSAFFDTNVILYLISEDAEKADIAERLIAHGGTVSVQVLNEFAAVCLRKSLLEAGEIRHMLATVRQIAAVVPVDISTHDRALEIAAAGNYAFYDCLIIAAASLASCQILYSEDLQDGHKLDGLRIVNPFKA